MASISMAESGYFLDERFARKMIVVLEMLGSQYDWGDGQPCFDEMCGAEHTARCIEAREALAYARRAVGEMLHG